MLYRSYVSEYKTDVVEVGTAVSNTDHQPVIVITMFAPSCLALTTREHLTYLYNFLDLREDDEKTRIILRRTEGRPLVRFVESTKLDHEMRVQIALEFLKKIVVYDVFPNSIKKKLLSEDQVFLNEDGVQLQEIVNYTNREPVSDQEVIARIGHILSILLPDSNEVELALINQMRHSREYATIREAYEAFRDVFVYQVPVTLEQRIIVNSASLPKITSEMIDSYQAEQEQRRRNEERLAEERRLRELKAEEERLRAQQFQEFNEKIEYQTKMSLTNADFAPSAFREKEISLSAADDADPYIPSSEMDYYGISLIKRNKAQKPAAASASTDPEPTDEGIYETVAGELVSEGSTGARWNPRVPEISDQTPPSGVTSALTDLPPSVALDRNLATEEIRLMTEGEKQQQIQDALQSITNRFKALFEETVHNFDVEKPREPEPFVDPFAHLPSDSERRNSAPNACDRIQSPLDAIEEFDAIEGFDAIDDRGGLDEMTGPEPDAFEEYEEIVPDGRHAGFASMQEIADEIESERSAGSDRAAAQPSDPTDEDEPSQASQEWDDEYVTDFETDLYEEVTIYDHHWTDDIATEEDHDSSSKRNRRKDRNGRKDRVKLADRSDRDNPSEDEFEEREDNFDEREDARDDSIRSVGDYDDYEEIVPLHDDDFSPEYSFKEELDDFYDSHDRELVRKRQLKRTMLLVLVTVITTVLVFFAYRVVSVMLEPLQPQFEITRQSETKVAFTNTSSGASKAHSYLWEVYYGGKLIRSSQDINLILEFKLEGEYLIRLSAENKDGTKPEPYEQTFQFQFGQ